MMKQFQHLDMDKALEQMKTASGYVLLDVRRPDEYEKGHIPGAINIPNEMIERMSSHLPDLDQRIYVYCRSGVRSIDAASKLVKSGYTNVIEIGGILSYNGALSYE